MPDYRLNSRSPYYIDGLVSVTENTPPDPIEENTPPTVTITVSDENPYIGQSVTITAVATDSDGNIVSYEWSTGETTQSIEADPSFYLPSNATEGCLDFYVVVTDNDGDTANATKRVCWQKVPEIITNPSEKEVTCGDTVQAGQFSGDLLYKITDVGDKIGDVEIVMTLAPEVKDVPVKFTLEWDGNTSTTNYIGSNDYDDELQANGIHSSDISTATDSTKYYPTSLTLNKSAATPTEVYVRATTPLVNDAFSFDIICPDPTDLSEPTFFYTLEGTCTTGDTTFSYTDSDGNPQTVVLANGDPPQLVSAQEDSVSVATCTGTSLKGGESFDNGTPTQDYDLDVEINIIFDNSGSMNDSLSPLMYMANGNLRDTLLQYYNNDQALYESKVRVIKSSDFYGVADPLNYISPEDFFKMMAHGKIDPTSTKSIYLVFADEIRDSYQVGKTNSSYSAIGSRYQSHIDNYRTFLNNTPYGEYFARMFKVDSRSTVEDQFFKNIFSGEDGFEGSKGLSDRSEVSIEQEILLDGMPYNRFPNYYYDFVIKALRDYGFNI